MPHAKTVCKALYSFSALYSCSLSFDLRSDCGRKIWTYGTGDHRHGELEFKTATSHLKKGFGICFFGGVQMQQTTLAMLHNSNAIKPHDKTFKDNLICLSREVG